MLTCSAMTSGLSVVLSTALWVMVVVVVQAGVMVVVGAGVVVKDSTTRLTASRTMVLSSSVVLEEELLAVTVILWAGLTVTTALCTPTRSTGPVVFWVSNPSNIEDGWNPSAKISGSH